MSLDTAGGEPARVLHGLLAEPARGEFQVVSQLTVEIQPWIQNANGQVAELLYQIVWVRDGLQVLS
jgi:hypothetical protein